MRLHYLNSWPTSDQSGVGTFRFFASLCLAFALGFAAMLKPGLVLAQTAEATEPAAEAGIPVADDAPSQDQPAGKQAPKPSLDERLDALLVEALPPDEYRETRRCLSRHDYRSVEILNQEYLLFVKNDHFWLNRLRTRCPSLRFDMVLSFAMRGTSSVCQSDQVYVTNRFDLERGFDHGGRPIHYQGICTLGEFESISPEQAALLSEVK